jgi:UDP-N-acetylmuramoylalanine--D-glutamate ligase
MLNLAGQRVTVFGLGRFGGGIAVSKWLVGQGAHVKVVDQDSPERLAESLRQLDGMPIQFRLGPDQSETDFTQSDLVVASPAIPPRNELLSAARASGVPITTEIRLFIERCPALICGVTGTKGKSTTTAMLGEMLKKRFTVHVGGNIGGSLLDKLPRMTASDWVVLELSSYMLEHLRADQWSPRIAVVTMIGADHIEWHGSVEAYVDAKKNLLRFQRPGDFAVLNGEDAGARAFATDARGKCALYGWKGENEFKLRVPGRHNSLNALGAFAAAKILGVTWDEAQEAMSAFGGLPHRLELVHQADGVRWYNDSIATIPEAAVAALAAFPNNRVIQIIGGKDKHLPAEGMCSALAERAKAVLCIGATGLMLCEMLDRKGGADVHHCGDLATAVSIARRIASEGDVVLLSPGYPSYDQFVNFEERGDAFAALARNT